MNKLKDLHPKCFIRDIRYETREDKNLIYSYIKVNKDDTWMRCNLILEIVPIYHTPTKWKALIKIVN